MLRSLCSASVYVMRHFVIMTSNKYRCMTQSCRITLWSYRNQGISTNETDTEINDKAEMFFV